MWHHISEHTPENGSTVVVMVGADLFVCEYDDGMFYDATTDDIYIDSEVDFWVSIPEPPEPMTTESESDHVPENRPDEYFVSYTVTEHLFVDDGIFFTLNLN